MARPYRTDEAQSLWELKQEFERSLGEGTGTAEKAIRYAEKLDSSYRGAYFDWVERCLSEEPRSVQLAERDDTVVGYVFVLPESFAYIWDGAILNELYVKPSFRNGGVGSELMEDAFDVARNQDLPLDRILLDVDRSNDRARSFYDSHGFEHWGEMMSRPL